MQQFKLTEENLREHLNLGKNEPITGIAFSRLILCGAVIATKDMAFDVKEVRILTAVNEKITGVKFIGNTCEFTFLFLDFDIFSGAILSVKD